MSEVCAEGRSLSELAEGELEEQSLQCKDISNQLMCGCYIAHKTLKVITK